MPTLHIVDNFLSVKGFDESAAYKNGTITHGYGRCTTVGATVQKGASVDIDIDFTLQTITQEKFDEWKTHAYTFMTQEQKLYLEEHYSARGKASGWFAAGIGAINANGSYDHYKNRTDSFQTENIENREGFMKSIYNLQSDNLRITGKLKAEGTSNIPVSVLVFVQITKITFSDKKEFVVINTENPIAASASGSTEGVKSDPTQLNIVPI